MAGAYRAPPPKIKMLIPITIDIPDDEIKELIKDAKTDTENEEEFFDYVVEYICDNIDYSLPSNQFHADSCDIISAVKDFMEGEK